jgi:hypothetical protein
MTTRTEPTAGSWPTSTAIGVALGWFAVLALSMWFGSNGSRPIVAWFVADPMFVLYPGVAALAASRTRSSNLVIALATLIPMAALWLVLSPAVFDTPFGVRDDRLKYAFVTLVIGLGLLVATRIGARAMRRGHPVLGFAVAGAFFVVATTIASFPLIVLLGTT